MTPGQAALAEAARLESARVYSRIVPEHRQPTADAEPAATDITAARVRASRKARSVARIEQAITRGESTRQIMNELRVRYSTVKAVRDRMSAA